MNILFVCSGNTCRSPMGMAIVNSKKIKGVTANSAGTAAFFNKVSSNAVKAIQSLNISSSFIEGYFSKPLTKELIKNADIIVAMEESHKNFILNNFDKSITGQKEFCVLNVADPYLKGQETYNKTAEEIYNKTLNLLKQYNLLKN